MAKNVNSYERDALDLLDLHHASFHGVKPYADRTDQEVPSDTKSWSQILVCLLLGLKGLARKKGADLADGSDVKAANSWDAIDRPRFNGSLPAGRSTAKSKKPADISALDDQPHLFFVLWDEKSGAQRPRCRVWCVRTQVDPVFRAVGTKWYDKRRTGEIKSTNFQLHPPIGTNSNVVRNTCGNMELPLLWCAVHDGTSYKTTHYDPTVMKTGRCKLAP